MSTFSGFLLLLAMAPAEDTGVANVPVEVEFRAERPHADPFGGVSLDVQFTDPKGQSLRVPAFWAGGDRWKVRYASPSAGVHRWRSICNDEADGGLHGKTGTVELKPYAGENPLYQHGPIRVAADHRHLEHADGTPFFWLGDTWWMGLCNRLAWPDDFQKLAADRKAKGFNVVQLVAGLYPDMEPFDPRGANEAGFPWEADYARIRPEYFDAADRRIAHLVEQGLSPCIVGAWGYFMPWMGEDKLQAHWRYLIARYGAYPVTWCAAGEANLPWYRAEKFPFDDQDQARRWCRVLRFIRESDPWRRPLTIHPTAINAFTARHVIESVDPGLIDFDFLQTPHGERDAGVAAAKTVLESREAKPTMPVINGEASYEMLSDKLPTRWTRAMYWLCVVNGAAGHTYGANGIWQVNRKGKPHGPSPTVGSPPTGYGTIAWDEAMNLPGSSQIAAAKGWIGRLRWWEFAPSRGSAKWDDSADAPELGQWIWHESDANRSAPVAKRWFRRTFDLPENTAVRRATLQMTADDRFTAHLNGEILAEGAGWNRPAVADAKARIRPGKNVLAVLAENSPAPVQANPAGLSGALAVVLEDGRTLRFETDGAWKSSDRDQEGWDRIGFDDAGWKSASVIGPYPSAPWGRIGPSTEIAPAVLAHEDGSRLLYMVDARPVRVEGLKPRQAYRATGFDPVRGEARTPFEAVADEEGRIRLEPPETGPDRDWAVLLGPIRRPG